jgi:hypothetical protein
MNQKDKSHHVVKAATKAEIYSKKADEDKADVKLALVDCQVAGDRKKHMHPAALTVNWQGVLPSIA